MGMLSNEKGYAIFIYIIYAALMIRQAQPCGQV